MINDFDLSSISGLSASEAAERLGADGFNELPSTKQRNVLAIALEVVREPMFLLLVACGAIYLILGDAQEAFMLLGFVFFIMGISLYQERKTERTLEALRDLSSPRALVIRDGKQKRIAGRDVVCGDTLLLGEGDRIPQRNGVNAVGVSIKVQFQDILRVEDFTIRSQGSQRFVFWPINPNSFAAIRSGA